MRSLTECDSGCALCRALRAQPTSEAREADRRDAQIMLDRMRSKLNTRGRHMLGSGLAGFRREIERT